MAREDYPKAQRDAWQATRLAAERARGQHSSKINALPRAPNPFGPQGTLAKAINEPIAATVKAKQKELDRSIASKAPKGSTIHSTVDSTCPADLSWKDGVATAEFYRGGQLIYDYDMSLEDFLEWVESDSIGQFGNAYVFE
jgi:hypothetical protein